MNKKILIIICAVLGVFLIVSSFFFDRSTKKDKTVNNEEFVGKIISNDLLNKDVKYKNITCYNLTVNEVSKDVYNLYFNVRNDSDVQANYSFKINIYDSSDNIISDCLVSVSLTPKSSTGIQNSIRGELSNAHHYEIVDIETNSVNDVSDEA